MLNSRLAKPSLESRNYDSSVFYFWVNLFRIGGGGGQKAPPSPLPLPVFPCNFCKRTSKPQKLPDFYLLPFCHTGVKLQDHT